MKFIQLLESGDILKAMEEVKSKLNGLKSGAMIDIEDEISEKYSNFIEEKNISTKLK